MNCMFIFRITGATVTRNFIFRRRITEAGRHETTVRSDHAIPAARDRTNSQLRPTIAWKWENKAVAKISSKDDGKMVMQGLNPGPQRY